MPEPSTIPLPDTAQPAAKPLLLSQPDAWAYLGLPRSTWFRLRSAGKLPSPVNVPSGGLFWRRADLDRWTGNLKPSRGPRRAYVRYVDASGKHSPKKDTPGAIKVTNSGHRGQANPSAG